MVFFHIVKDLFKSNEGLLRSGKVQIGSKGEGIFVLAGLRKKYLTRCQISRSKYYLYRVQQIVFFHIVKDLFKSIEGLFRSGKVQIGSKGEGIFVLAGLKKKVLNTLSDFALKILSLNSLTNSVFPYSEGLIQIN